MLKGRKCRGKNITKQRKKIFNRLCSLKCSRYHILQFIKTMTVGTKKF